jgi:Carbohydrate-selective porin, OprB family
MMQSYVLRFLSRSALFSVLVGFVLAGLYSAEGSVLAAQPQNSNPTALTTVKSNHWTFRSLKSLAERYGCVINPSGMFFSPTATPSRYEMAAALNACLDQIADRFSTPKDEITAQALLKEFKGEMAVLRSRVSQDCRVPTLESQQFSASPRTHGEVIIGTPSSSDLALKSQNKPLEAQQCALTTKVFAHPEFYAQFPGLQPNHWSFQAIQSLSTRYHCTPYTFGPISVKGAAISRYNMAVSVNTCLNLIGHRFASQKDLKTAQALQKEFKPELTALKGRVDSFNKETQKLEFNQFSTTTKLQGQAVITIQGGGFR